MRYLLVFVIAAVCSAIPLEKGEYSGYHNYADQHGSRIHDGLPATAGQFPWHVIIMVGRGICGGSLISNEWVLTAAHCFQGASLRLDLGAVDQSIPNDPGRITVYSSNFYRHPDFQGLRNDIGLVKLPQPVVTNTRIQAIPIYTGASIGADVNVTLSGWGKNSLSDPFFSSHLKYVTLDTISNTECAETYGPVEIIDSSICTVGHPHHSGCAGDSGGPLVYYDASGVAKQVGVSSFIHPNGCSSGLPSGYARPGSYLTWINEITGLYG